MQIGIVVEADFNSFGGIYLVIKEVNDWAHYCVEFYRKRKYTYKQNNKLEFPLCIFL